MITEKKKKGFAAGHESSRRLLLRVGRTGVTSGTSRTLLHSRKGRSLEGRKNAEQANTLETSRPRGRQIKKIPSENFPTLKSRKKPPWSYLIAAKPCS